MRLDHEKVRWHRDRLGWTLDTLAEKAEVAKGTVLRAEHGEDVRPTSGRRIARALGTEIADLIPEKPGRVEELATAGPLGKAPGEAGHSIDYEGLSATLEDLQRVASLNERYHELQKTMDEYRELWEKRLSEEDLDKAAFEEAGRALRAFWPAVAAAADAEMYEFKRLGIDLEVAKAESVLLPAIARFQALGDKINRAYREKFQNVPASNLYVFPQREVS